MHFNIVPVRTADDLAAMIALFRAYARSLDVDLAYQDFEAEMAAMISICLSRRSTFMTTTS